MPFFVTIRALNTADLAEVEMFLWADPFLLADGIKAIANPAGRASAGGIQDDDRTPPDRRKTISIQHWRARECQTHWLDVAGLRL